MFVQMRALRSFLDSMLLSIMRMSSVGSHSSDMVAVGTSHVSVGHVRVGRKVVTKITRIPAGMIRTGLVFKSNREGNARG